MRLHDQKRRSDFAAMLRPRSVGVRFFQLAPQSSKHTPTMSAKLLLHANGYVNIVQRSEIGKYEFDNFDFPSGLITELSYQSRLPVCPFLRFQRDYFRFQSLHFLELTLSQLSLSELSLS